MTSSVPEHNLRQINKNKEERDQEKKWKKKEETLIAQTQKVIRQTRGIVGGGWGGL